MIDKAKKWVSEGNRSIEIEIGTVGDRKHFRIWAYDYDLMQGQTVKSIEEIDLAAEKERHEREQFEKLKAKYS